MLLQMALFHSFLWLSNIPVCVCVCVCVHHIFFICSSVNEHLGCFHVLATVNSAATNIGVQTSFQIIGHIYRENCNWLLLLSIMFSGVIHVVVCNSVSLF